MTTEDQPIDKSNPSLSANSSSSQRMHGWFKLRETLLKSDPPSNESVRPLSNSNFNNISSKQQIYFPSTTNTNGHMYNSSETINPSDSPPNIFASPSMISLASTPRQTIDELPVLEFESASIAGLRRESIPLIEIDSATPTAASSSSPASSDSKRSPTRSRRILGRKSTKSKETMKPIEISTPITEDISDDDDMPLIDIRKHKPKSIDTLSTPCVNDSIIPLATDLQSLPGHSQNEIRDIRFLDYSDVDKLSLHLNVCLYVDKTSFPFAQQRITETGYNVLIKIFNLHYIKTLKKNLSLEKKSLLNKKDNHKQQPLHVISSPTSASFKIDWAANRRNSSTTQRTTPNNFFHILQLNPAKQLSPANTSSSATSKTPVQNFERIKDILARAYYPHLHTAIECGYHFGIKSNFPNTQHLISTHDDVVHIKEMPISPDLNDDSVTITLKSPPSITRRDAIQFSAIAKLNEPKSFAPVRTERRLSEEIDDISSLVIRKSFVVLTPTQIPLPSPPSSDKEKKSNTNRKRKASATTNAAVKEKNKKRNISSPSSDVVTHIEDISDADRYLFK